MSENKMKFYQKLKSQERHHLREATVEKDEAKKWSSLKTLKFIEGNEYVPNLYLALKIFKTVCVSIIFCKRTFPKLNKLKSNPRSTMTE